MLAARDSYFRAFLEAKMSSNDDSLNQRVFAQFSSAIARAASPVILDIGTGTGAMIRRIIRSVPLPSIVFYGIDANKELLDEGRRRVNEQLKELGYAVRAGDQIISAAQGARTIEVHLVAGDLFEERMRSSLSATPFTAVTTHAFMDLVPVDGAIGVFAELLGKGGLFYSTINYDGAVEFLPFFEDRALEGRLLELYSQSLEQQTGDAAHDGSARTGSLLYDRCTKHGFEVSGYGSSDWSVFPWDRDYRRDEEIFLNSLLLSIYEEGLRHPEIDRYPLSAWYAARSEAVEERELALMTHQTDLLAVRR